MNPRFLLFCTLSLITAAIPAGCIASEPAPDTAPASPSAPGATTADPANPSPTEENPPASTDEPEADPSPSGERPPASTDDPAEPPAEDPAPTTDAPTNVGPAPVNLGSAASFAILAKSGISTVPASAITGDIGTSPIDSTAITGFSLVMDSTNVFATSPQVTGKVYAADYTSPTPAGLTSAVSDMETAYTDAAGRSDPDATEVGAGEIGGLTMVPGLYKWGTGVLVTTSVTLDAQGNPDAVWIFQIAQDLVVANGQHVTLAGGAQAGNVYWQVAGHADIGTGAHFAGNLLTQNEISLKSGATMTGRALAQTAVTLDANTVTRP